MHLKRSKACTLSASAISPGAHVHSPGRVFCHFQSPPFAGSRCSGAAAELAPSPAASARPPPSAGCSSNRRPSHRQREEKVDFIVMPDASHAPSPRWVLTSLSSSLTSLSKRLVAFLKEGIEQMEEEALEFCYVHSINALMARCPTQHTAMKQNMTN